MHRSFRSRARVSAAGLFRHRPRLERLEPRLPPGDALLGLLVASPEMFDLSTPGLERDLFASRDAAVGDVSASSNLRRESPAKSCAVTTTSDDATSHDVQRRTAALSSVGHTAGFNPAARHTASIQRVPGFNQTAHAFVPGLPIFAPRAAGFTSAVRSGANPGATAITPAGLTAGINPAARQESSAVENYGDLPLTFEANHGQTDARVDFIARTGGATMFVTPTALVMAISGLHESPGRAGGVNPLESAANQGVHTPRSPGEPGAALHMQIVGANPSTQPTGVNQQPGIVNYFIGNDPSQWHSNIPTFAAVRYDDVYSGIDLAYYGNGGQLEYDFIVSPGADPDAIALNFAGADRVDVNAQGDLVLHTPAGEVVQQKPFTYQEVGGTRREVPSGYVVDGTEVRFDVGAYDAGRELVIDPLVLGYSTLLGGAIGDDGGYGITVDADGNAYVTGYTSSNRFPTTSDAFDKTYQGQTDAFVTKLNANGSGLIYSTYLGGSELDRASAIAVDGPGNAYVAGTTTSDDFPTTPDAFDTTDNDGPPCCPADGFVAKLNADGNALVYSTYLGGYINDSIYGIAIDGGGNAHVTGQTSSLDFPSTPDAFDPTYEGGPAQAFVTELNKNGSALVYSTFIGGANSEAGSAIDVDNDGNAYVIGQTYSSDFPTTPFAFDTSYNGLSDAFVAKLSADGSALVYSTYLGGSGYDNYAQGAALAVDVHGNAYVTSSTPSSDFPTTPGSFDRTYNGGHSFFGDTFVTKLSGDGRTLDYSTYLGGSDSDFGRGIAVDDDGFAYVTGGTRSRDFPTTPFAFDNTYNGNGDVFVTKVSRSGTTLVYSTYLGGLGSVYTSDHGAAIAVDGERSAYVTGQTGSSNFPTTPDAFKRRKRSGDDAFVTKFAEV